MAVFAFGVGVGDLNSDPHARSCGKPFGAGVGDLSPLCSESATPVLSLTFFPMTETVFHLVKQTYKTMKETGLTQ